MNRADNPVHRPGYLLSWSWFLLSWLFVLGSSLFVFRIVLLVVMAAAATARILILLFGQLIAAAMLPRPTHLKSHLVGFSLVGFSLVGFSCARPLLAALTLMLSLRHRIYLTSPSESPMPLRSGISLCGASLS